VTALAVGFEEGHEDEAGGVVEALIPAMRLAGLSVLILGNETQDTPCDDVEGDEAEEVAEKSGTHRGVSLLDNESGEDGRGAAVIVPPVVGEGEADFPVVSLVVCTDLLKVGTDLSEGMIGTGLDDDGFVGYSFEYTLQVAYGNVNGHNQHPEIPKAASARWVRFGSSKPGSSNGTMCSTHSFGAGSVGDFS